MTSKDLLPMAIVDDVIREPLGGAHRDHHLAANRLKIYLRNTLRELVEIPTAQLVEMRYRKFRRMGVFLEGAAAADSLAETSAAAELSGVSADPAGSASRKIRAPHGGPVFASPE
jgi:hypothetical protein